MVKANGFDTGSGKFSVHDWITYCKSHYKKIGIRTSDSIFEIGCGAGAFLFLLYEKQHAVAGIDYSSELIKLANKFMPKANFKETDATSFSQDQKYDVIISHGVFFYFESLQYAEEVAKRMINAAVKKIAILDICDFDKKEIYHEVRISKFIEEGHTEDEYWKHYEGLDHLFYTKDFFRDLGKQHNLNTEIYDQNYQNYENSKLRFNVIYTK